MWRTVLLLLLLPAGEACAFKPKPPYKPPPPDRHDVFSENGKFVLDVNPQANRLTVYVAGKREQPMWSFNRKIALGEHFLSEDGKVVAFTAWRFVQAASLSDGVCVEFWDQMGKFREYTFAELCPNPAGSYSDNGPLEMPGPVGRSWRKWYSEAIFNGDRLRIRTTDEFEYTFAIDDGSIVEKTRIALPRWLWMSLMAFGATAVMALAVICFRRSQKAFQPSLSNTAIQTPPETP